MSNQATAGSWQLPLGGSMSDKNTALKTLEDEYQNLLKAIKKLDNAQLSQTWL